MDIVERNLQNRSLADALTRAGIKRNALPEFQPPRALIEAKEIPDTLKKKINDVLGECLAQKIPMPFIHITLEKVLKDDSQVIPTGFVESILTEGTRLNTNGATFVKRSLEENATLADPAYFIDHPESFVEDLALMVQRYTHHGIRTNKKSLGMGYGYKTNKQTDKGSPTMIIVDRDAIPLKRGKDGDDHYVLLERSTPSKIIGTLKLDSFESMDKHTALELADNFLSLLGNYLQQKVQ